MSNKEFKRQAEMRGMTVEEYAAYRMMLRNRLKNRLAKRR